MPGTVHLQYGHVMAYTVMFSAFATMEVAVTLFLRQPTPIACLAYTAVCAGDVERYLHMLNMLMLVRGGVISWGSARTSRGPPGPGPSKRVRCYACVRSRRTGALADTIHPFRGEGRRRRRYVGTVTCSGYARHAAAPQLS